MKVNGGDHVKLTEKIEPNSGLKSIHSFKESPGDLVLYFPIGKRSIEDLGMANLEHGFQNNPDAPSPP
jgi:hypothetical protein